MREEKGRKEKEPSLKDLRALYVDYKALMLAIVERAYFDCVEILSQNRNGYKSYSNKMTKKEFKSAMRFMFDPMLEDDLMAFEIDPEIIMLDDIRLRVLEIRASVRKQAVLPQ